MVLSFTVFLCTTLIVQVSAQYWPYAPAPAVLSPLYGGCGATMPCRGVAVCVNMVCECPAPLYRAVGGSCQPVLVNALHLVPSVRTAIVYGQVGFPCAPWGACNGGATCVQGSCACGAGLVVSRGACVAAAAPLAPAALLAPAAPLVLPGRAAAVVAAAAAVPPLVGGCAGGCSAGMVCMGDACGCPAGYVARAGGRCGPLVAVAQSTPGGACLLGEECTGGSVCLGGVCSCYDGLAQVGDVCVQPPMPPMPVPVPVPLVAAPLATLTTVAVGLPCAIGTAPCVAGAVCHSSVCTCGPAFTPVGPTCVRRWKRK